MSTGGPAPAGRLLVPKGRDVHDFLVDKAYTDGLPVVPPTPHRVRCMLRASHLAPDEDLGQCPPNMNTVTVEKVATNAVMAGCRPKQFRVVIAAVRAMLHPTFGLHGNSATTMGATPCVLVNGPVRLEAGLNFKHGVLGSGSQANATIGRAVKLVLQNIGGAKLGGTESTTLGTPMKYTMCAAEWEERCSEWEPLHVTRGYTADESVVTVLAVAGGPTQIVDNYLKTAEDVVDVFAQSMHNAYSCYFPFVNDCLLVVSPEHYDTLYRGGIRSKKQLAEALWKQSNKHYAPSIRKTIELVSKAGIFGTLAGGALGLLARAANLVTGGGLPFIPKFLSPESFHVVLAGGPAGKFSAWCPGFGIGKEGMPSYKMSSPVSMKVDPLPALFSEESKEVLEEEVGKEGELVLMNPKAEESYSVFEPATRTGEMKGLVGLLDISKPGGSVLLARLAERLRHEFPDLSFENFRKPTFSRPCPAVMRQDIASRCQFVVAALAD